MQLPLVKDAKVEGKTVLLRLDLDVPISDTGKILDDTRLHVGLDSLSYLLHRGAFVIVIGHRGRPQGRDEKLSLQPVVDWFCNHLRKEAESTKLGQFEGWRLSKNLTVLENIRFYDGEEENDPEFAKRLASLGEIYVNDAFADCHRAHSSVVGLADQLPHFAGLRLELEVRELSHVLEHPKRPLCIIVGGAKLETKAPLIEKMHHHADYILVGGKIAEDTRFFLTVQHERIKKKRSALLIADLNSNHTDITPNSLENFLQIVGMSRTIIWNGPLGIIENSEYKTQEARAKEADSGTQKLAEGIIKGGSRSVIGGADTVSIVGGGDTLGFLKAHNLLDSFHFFSTGGGAMLSFLAGEKMPGLEALLK